MIPVYQHRKGDKSGLNYEKFESEIGYICEQHKREGRALAFALLLYDFTSPGVWKMLDDKHYWFALDEAAGKTISVFSIHTPPWLFENGEEKSLHSIRGGDPGRSARHIINKYFPLDGEAPVPGLVFFQVEEGVVIDAYLVKIKSKKVEDIFNEILEIITISSDSLRHVLPENRNNSLELFNLVVRSMQNRKLGKTLRLAVDKALKVKEFLTLFITW
jgi:hypothetical protein